MDEATVLELAAKAGFETEQRSALLEPLTRFANLVLALREANQEAQAHRLIELWYKLSPEEIRRLADAGELGRHLPTFELPPYEDLPLRIEDLVPLESLDLTKKW
jgi:hypothetical protein